MYENQTLMLQNDWLHANNLKFYGVYMKNVVDFEINVNLFSLVPKIKWYG